MVFTVRNAQFGVRAGQRPSDRFGKPHDWVKAPELASGSNKILTARACARLYRVRVVTYPRGFRGDRRVDFTKMGGGSVDVDPRDVLALYGTLDKQHTHVELRPAQESVLLEWEKQRDQRDVVLKLATGAGKTTLGLVMLYSHMLESQRPCLFLCPTNQLVEQVLREGEKCGVPTVAAVGGEEIPHDGLNAEAVIVTSVQSIFQARAGRWTAANVYAIAIDDAHTAVDIVRQQFTVSIPAGNSTYADLLSLFLTALREQGRGTTEEIENGQSAGALEVPYWKWMEQQEAVTAAVTELSKSEDDAYRKKQLGDVPGLPLHWGLIKNILLGCRCFFSSKAVEISPEVPPVERVKAYNGAERRIFMSATISDESVLVRELGCDPEAARNPVETPNAGGIGERMILVPRLMAEKKKNAPGWADIVELCKRVSARHAVVVIAPTKDAALKWQRADAKVVTRTEDVPTAVQDLRDLKSRFVVFANRYDGIDLPDAACRMLVLDGLPIAYSLMDLVDMACDGGTSIRRRAVMHRVEQGMGRAVRSISDYAVVVLQGDELATLISMREHRRDLTEQTRKQLELGMRIAQEVKRSSDWHLELETLVNQCLNRDKDWRRMYQQSAKAAGAPQAADEVAFARATAERAAWNAHANNRGTEAVSILRKFMNEHDLDNGAKAFLMQRVAWYLRKDSPEESLSVQTAARALDYHLLMPSSGVTYKKSGRAAPAAGARFATWLSQFEHSNGAPAAIDALQAKLVFSPIASHDAFEQALCDLGDIIGFESSRPDKLYHEGPDVLWLEGQNALPLEAKNRIGDDTDGIAKHVAAQLMQAEAWTKRTHSERDNVVPVSVHPRTKLSKAAQFPSAARILTPTLLDGLLESLRAAVSDLTKGGATVTPDAAARALTSNKLSMKAILSERLTRPD